MLWEKKMDIRNEKGSNLQSSMDLTFSRLS